MSNTFKDMPDWVRGWLLTVSDPRVNAYHHPDCVNCPVHEFWGLAAAGANEPCALDGPVRRTREFPGACQLWVVRHDHVCACCGARGRRRGRQTRQITRNALREAARFYNTSGEDDLDVDVFWS